MAGSDVRTNQKPEILICFSSKTAMLCRVCVDVFTEYLSKTVYVNVGYLC